VEKPVKYSPLAVSGIAASSQFEETKPTMPSVPAGSERFARAGSVPGDAQIESLRLPPHSVEAEQAVLGGLLLSNAAWDRIGDVISETDFYRSDHRIVWRTITRLVEDNKPADVLTVAEALKLSGEINDIGGLAYLHQLASGTPSAANIRRYAEIVRERAIMRKLAEVGTNIADSAYSPQGREARQLLDEAETRILEIGEKGGRSSESFAKMSAVLAEVMSRLDELHRNPASVTGKATGFVDLDEMTTGLQDGDLIIVAGRPSMGKAQSLDCQVKTRAGWKAMGEMRVGDELASVDGAPSVVTGVFPQGERQVYRIAFSDGRSTECCAEHLWRVHSDGWQGARVIATQDIIRLLGSRLLWIDLAHGDFGHDDPQPVDPWVLGAILADGVPQDPPSREDDGDTAVAVRTASTRYNTLCVALTKLGLSGLTREREFVPEVYKNASRRTRIAVLQGLLDTDGDISPEGEITLRVVGQRLAHDIVDLVRSVGGWCRCDRGSRGFVLHIGHADPRQVFRLSSKRNRFLAGCGDSARIAIASVAPSRVTQTQCIAVSHPSRLYITDEYVVTHNTSLALNIAEHVGLELKLPVLVFSMEMGGTQLATRLLGSVGKVDAQKLRTGKLDPTDWDRLGVALGKLNEAPILIDETAALNPMELRARARRKKREYGGLGLIVVDYIQLMQGTDAGSENRATEVGEISRGLKSMAKELSCPVMALSQLNRSLEQRPNKRPVMSDLRESGAIEQDADMIFFIYRDEVYNEDSPDKGIAEIIIGKQRNGPIGTIKLTFLGKHTRFENYSGAPGY
jgi:replicative DNA helicase